MPDESLAAGRTNAGLEVTDRQTDTLVMGLVEKLRMRSCGSRSTRS